MDSETREAFRLVWDQGINVLRDDMRELKSSVSSARRWFIGMMLGAAPAYIMAVIALAKR